MTPDNYPEPPTAESLRAKFRRSFWNCLDRLADRPSEGGLPPLAVLALLNRSLPPGCIIADVPPPNDGDAAEPTVDQVRAKCQRLFRELLDRPDVWATLRHAAADEKLAKRHRAVIARARLLKPELFTESDDVGAPSPTASSGISVKTADGGTLRFGKNTVTFTRPSQRPAPKIDRASIRARSADSYYESRGTLIEIANDPKASRKDRARARAVLKKYGEPPPNGKP